MLTFYNVRVKLITYIKGAVNMRDTKTLYQKLTTIQNSYEDTSYIPKMPSGLILDKDKEKYADVLAHNDRIFQLERAFNSTLTKAEKLALRDYKRSLNKSFKSTRLNNNGANNVQ